MEKCRFPRGCERPGQLERILFFATESLAWGESPLPKGADIVLCDFHAPVVKADPARYFEPDESFVPLIGWWWPNRGNAG